MKFTPSNANSNYAEIEFDVAVDGYSRTPTSGVAVKDEITTTTTKNPDGSTTTTTVNNKTGTTIEVTEYPDGSKKTVETRSDKTKITTLQTPERKVTSEIETSGNKKNDVTIPVDDSKNVIKVIFVDKDGKETEITDYTVTKDGIKFKATGSGSVKIVKNKLFKEFTDVHPVKHWAMEDIDYVYALGLMLGISENEFGPDDMLTRAMLVTVLYRAAGEPQVSASESFTDVEKGTYYYDAVIWAQQNGIVNGVGNNKFEPEENITREQIAVIMYRYAKFMGYDVSVGEDTNILSYTDFDEISEYAIEAMQYAVGSGLIKGKTASTLNPQENATRAEVAAILHRFMEAH